MESPQYYTYHPQYSAPPPASTSSIDLALNKTSPPPLYTPPRTKSQSIARSTVDSPPVLKHPEYRDPSVFQST